MPLSERYAHWQQAEGEELLDYTPEPHLAAVEEEMTRVAPWVFGPRPVAGARDPVGVEDEPWTR
jgi:hypothetical protein